jgi:hypothetical protein
MVRPREWGPILGPFRAHALNLMPRNDFQTEIGLNLLSRNREHGSCNDPNAEPLTSPRELRRSQRLTRAPRFPLRGFMLLIWSDLSSTTRSCSSSVVLFLGRALFPGHGPRSRAVQAVEIATGAVTSAGRHTAISMACTDFG